MLPPAELTNSYYIGHAVVYGEAPDKLLRQTLEACAHG